MSGTIFGQMPKIERGVSKELAKWRAANYSDVKFGVNLRLEKLSPTLTKIEKLSQKLRGAVVISLFNKGDLIVLDWRKLKGREDLSKISNLSVNDRPAYFEERDGHLILKEGVLKNKPNTIRFEFTTPVQTRGAAAARYVDENDESEYLYSVPNAENDLFPAFDQPDLKARFKLTAVKPDSWKAEIVTNSDGGIIGSFRPGETIYSFEETGPISPQLFAFAAGDFAVVKDEADIFPVKTAPVGSSIIYEPRKNPNAAKVYVRRSREQNFRQNAAEFLRLNRKKDKSAKLDIILLPEISNVRKDFDGIKFVPESAVFR